MNVFYASISRSFIYLVYFVFALVVAYFVVYPDKFFLLLKDAECFAKKFVSPNKRNINNSTNMVESYERIDIPNEVENNRIEDKGQEKERNSQENTENIRKGGNTAYYY